MSDYRERFERLGFKVQPAPASGSKYLARLPKSGFKNTQAPKRAGDFYVCLQSGDWTHNGTMLHDRPFDELAHYVGRSELAEPEPAPRAVLTSANLETTPPKPATEARRPPCPRDTNGDGDCGNRYCPHCGERPPKSSPIVSTSPPDPAALEPIVAGLPDSARPFALECQAAGFTFLPMEQQSKKISGFDTGQRRAMFAGREELVALRGCKVWIRCNVVSLSEFLKSKGKTDVGTEHPNRRTDGHSDRRREPDSAAHKRLDNDRHGASPGAAAKTGGPDVQPSAAKEARSELLTLAPVSPPPKPATVDRPPPESAAPPGSPPAEYVTREPIPRTGGAIPAGTTLILTQLHPPHQIQTPNGRWDWHTIEAGPTGNFQTRDGRTVSMYPLSKLDQVEWLGTIDSLEAVAFSGAA